jgi:hypothetical protein
MVNKMDLKSGSVVPFYVTVETHGTEGQILNVEDKVKEVILPRGKPRGILQSLSVTSNRRFKPLPSGKWRS